MASSGDGYRKRRNRARRVVDESDIVIIAIITIADGTRWDKGLVTDTDIFGIESLFPCRKIIADKMVGRRYCRRTS